MTDTIRYFDQVAGGWTDKYRHSGHFRRRLETVLSWVDRVPATYSILDFGCGSGVMMQALLARGFAVTGVDASADMIQSARRTLRAANLTAGYELESVSANQYDGTYLGAVYHGVICLGVLEYVEAASRLLATLARVMAPGGFLILSVPNQTSLLRKLEMFVHRHPRLFRGIPMLKPFTEADSYLNFQRRQFTLRWLDREATALGLKLEAVEYQVSPAGLQAFEGHAWVGMTMLVKYRKAPVPNAAAS
ncbi:MAG TPA: methyltransferase domain-containing protein [Candidatus Margulisiibacteriota bacterium]|nr:methyltransferase domain-containing protein [Candidatus Margulisiibacteriota bacterium]